MWIPKFDQDILVAIEAGDLEETTTFDAKAALQSKGKREELRT